MGFLLSRLGRYITARVIGGVLIALVAVLASILLIDLVEQTREVGRQDELGLLEALRLTLLKTPMLVEQTLPFVVLAGSMMAVIGLNRSSELVAMRAAGVSAWRFLAPPAFAGLAIGIVTITALNPLGAFLYGQFESEREDVLTAASAANSDGGLWIRQGNPEGQVVIHAEGVDPSGVRLQNATFMFFEVRQEALRFVRRIRAEQAELKPGFWQLSNLVEATPGGRPVRHTHLAIPTTLDYELKWQGLLAYPLLLATMAGLGAAFSLQLQRLGNLARWGAAGAGIGLFLFFYSQLAGAFAMTQSVPAAVAAWSAPLAGMFIALSIVAFIEDG